MTTLTRSIPRSLAALVTQLELDRPSAVSVEQIAQMSRDTGVTTPPRVAIQRLAARGWLLPTGVRGTWEFAPGDRAGPYSDRDPLLPLRAVLVAEPGVALRDRPAVALGSALWLHDLAERAPDKLEVALPKSAATRMALARLCRVVHFEPVVSPVLKRGVPVHTAATILVHLAHRPSHVRSWGSVLETLDRLVAAADEQQIVEELHDRPHATHVRLAYLLSGLAPKLVRHLRVKPGTKVWFGGRGALRHHDAVWNVADTLLPTSPASLGGRSEL